MKPQAWVLLAAFAALGFVLWHGQPSDDGIVFCFSQRFFGIACPGCGMGRALHALLHLHIGESVYFNPLGIPFFLYGVCLATVSAFDLVRGTEHFRKWLHFKVTVPIAVLFLAVIAFVWIRNINMY